MQTGELAELGRIVDEALDTTVSDPFDLERLLDHYVELALARQKYSIELRRVEPPRLRATLAQVAGGEAPAMYRAQVLERRISCAQALSKELEHADDQLATVGELIRYYGERANAFALGSLVETSFVASALERFDALETIDCEFSQQDDALRVQPQGDSSGG